MVDFYGKCKIQQMNGNWQFLFPAFFNQDDGNMLPHLIFPARQNIENGCFTQSQIDE